MSTVSINNVTWSFWEQKKDPPSRRPIHRRPSCTLRCVKVRAFQVPRAGWMGRPGISVSSCGFRDPADWKRLFTQHLVIPLPNKKLIHGVSKKRQSSEPGVSSSFPVTERILPVRWCPQFSRCTDNRESPKIAECNPGSADSSRRNVPGPGRASEYDVNGKWCEYGGLLISISWGMPSPLKITYSFESLLFRLIVLKVSFAEGAL